MTINDDQDDLDQYNKLIARQSVAKEGEQWIINFPKPIKGIDKAKTYPTRETAINAAYLVLKMQNLQKKAT